MIEKLMQNTRYQTAAVRGAGGVGVASGEKRLGKADGRLPVELSIGSPGSEAATPT